MTIIRDNQEPEPKQGCIYVMVAHFKYATIRAPEVTADLVRSHLEEFITLEAKREDSPYKTLSLYEVGIPAGNDAESTLRNEYRMVEFINHPLDAVTKYGQPLMFVELPESKNQPKVLTWGELFSQDAVARMVEKADRVFAAGVDIAAKRKQQEE